MLLNRYNNIAKIPEDGMIDPTSVGSNLLGLNSNLKPKSGIVGAIATALGGIIATAMTNHANRQNIKAQNAYNTPKAQMQRYRDAGLNPHLIYGQGNPGNQQQVAQYQAPDLSGLLSAGAGLVRNEYDMELQRYQMQNMQAQNQLLRAQAMGQLLNNKWVDSAKKAEIANTLADSALKEANKVKTQAETNYINGVQTSYTQQQLNESIKRVELLDLQKDAQNIANDIAKIDRSIKMRTKEDTIKQLKAMADLARTNADYEAFAFEIYKTLGVTKEQMNQSTASAIITELRRFVGKIFKGKKDGAVGKVVSKIKDIFGIEDDEDGYTDGRGGAGSEF